MQYQIDPTSKIAALHSQFGVSAFFKIYSSPDKSNSAHSIAAIYQGGLGLPDRDYYFDADKAEKREKYVSYIALILGLVGSYGGSGFAQYLDENRNKQFAQEILQFETQIAGFHLTRTESRDPNKTFNKMSLDKLVDISKPPLTWGTYLARGNNSHSLFDWRKYFELIGKGPSEVGEINVATVEAIKGFPPLLESPTLTHYLVFHVVSNFAPHLSTPFSVAHFEFYQKYLEGTQEQKPRWKRALAVLESALGEALGQLYVAKHFSGDSKPKVFAHENSSIY